jgi:hypothetical protein
VDRQKIGNVVPAKAPAQVETIGEADDFNRDLPIPQYVRHHPFQISQESVAVVARRMVFPPGVTSTVGIRPEVNERCTAPGQLAILGHLRFTHAGPSGQLRLSDLAGQCNRSLPPKVVLNLPGVGITRWLRSLVVLGTSTTAGGLWHDLPLGIVQYRRVQKADAKQVTHDRVACFVNAGPVP